MSQKFLLPFTLKCPYGPLCEKSLSPKPPRIARKGYYWRKEDARWITRYRCLGCKRSFSSSRLTPCFRQHKRRMNVRVDLLQCSGVSQNRIARLLRINRKTVVRKLLFNAEQARLGQERFLAQFQGEKITAIQFDEMESFEKSKCLPISISLIVLPESRKILGFKVGRMPAKGPLTEISQKKYGPREDDRAEMVDALFSELKPLISPKVHILSDQNPKYPSWIKKHFPQAEHQAVKGRRGCIVGQGELKKIGFDPLFDLNHTCAMIRANINRLFRRTWCTTKKRDRLEAHLHLYVRYHNEVLT